MGNLRELFLSLDGRIGRARFWLGTLSLVVAALFLFILLHALGLGHSETVSGSITVENGETGEFSRTQYTLTPLGALVYFVLLVVPSAALLVKRRHDRGSAGYEVYVMYGIMFVGTVASFFGDAGTSVGGVLSLVVAAFSLFFLVVCGFLKGNEGANAYGPDPLAK